MNRLRLSLTPEMVDALGTMASDAGVTVDEMVARLLAAELPRLVGEDVARQLRTALFAAYPIDVAGHVPVIPEPHPDTHPAT